MKLKNVTIWIGQDEILNSDSPQEVISQLMDGLKSIPGMTFPDTVTIAIQDDLETGRTDAFAYATTRGWLVQVGE